MSQRHQIQTGPNAGKWAPCPAKKSCRNKGIHVHPNELHYARLYHEQQTGTYLPRVAELPLKVVEDYINLSEEERKKLNKDVAVEKAKRQAEKKGEVFSQKELQEVLDLVDAKQADTNKVNASSGIDGNFPLAQNRKIAQELRNIWQTAYHAPKTGKDYDTLVKEIIPKVEGLANHRFSAIQFEALKKGINDLVASNYDAGGGNFSATQGSVGLLQRLRGVYVSTWVNSIAAGAKQSKSSAFFQKKYEELVAFYQKQESTEKTSTPVKSSAPAKKEKKPNKVLNFLKSFKITEM